MIIIYLVSPESLKDTSNYSSQNEPILNDHNLKQVIEVLPYLLVEILIMNIEADIVLLIEYLNQFFDPKSNENSIEG